MRPIQDLCKHPDSDGAAPEHPSGLQPDKGAAGLAETAVPPHRRLVAQENATGLAAPHVPQADGAVGAAAGHIVAVGVPPHNIYISLVTCIQAAPS